MGFRRNMTEALELPKEILLHLPLISFIGQEEIPGIQGDGYPILWHPHRA